jgi:hypothetical protein
MVSAWANTNNLVLAQSNEITAVPKLLQALELSGTVVTIGDGMPAFHRPANRGSAKPTTFWRSRKTRATCLEEVKDSCRMLAADSVPNRWRVAMGRRTAYLLGDRRSKLIGETFPVGFFTGLGAYPIRAFPQGHGPNRIPDWAQTRQNFQTRDSWQTS